MAANGGSLAVEVLSQVPEATHFVLPMGGGGLAGGFSWYAKSKIPHAKIIVCQLADSPAFKLSLEQGKPITYMPPIDTLAGGLEGGTCCSAPHGWWAPARAWLRLAQVGPPAPSGTTGRAFRCEPRRLPSGSCSCYFARYEHAR